MAMQFEIIELNEVEPSPRGKRINWNHDLFDALRALPEDKALKLEVLFGRSNDKNERQRIAHTIKRHWEKVRNDVPSVIFSEEGIPQVRVNKNPRRKFPERV